VQIGKSTLSSTFYSRFNFIY